MSPEGAVVTNPPRWRADRLKEQLRMDRQAEKLLREKLPCLLKLNRSRQDLPGYLGAEPQMSLLPI